MATNQVGTSSDPKTPAVQGTHSAAGGHGVLGVAQSNGVVGHSIGSEGFAGVFGDSVGGPGVSAHSVNSVGVDAKTDSGPAALRAIHAGEGPGVLGVANNNGVVGRSIGSEGFAGVFGDSVGGPGVSAHSVNSVGVDQLCTLPWLGFVPVDVASAPPVAVARLAARLGVDPVVLVGYGK
ncbi:MAG: hypothetical protein WCF36_15020, partial [Candidatus Nanopelagicales bacterium]